MRWSIGLLVAALIAGCTPFDRPEFGMVMEKVTRMETAVTELSGSAVGLSNAAVKILEKEGLLADWLARAHATGHDPRIIIAEVTEKRYEIGLGGVHATLLGELHGVGKQIPLEVMSTYLDRIADPATTAEERTRLIEIIRTDLARTQPRNPPGG